MIVHRNCILIAKELVSGYVYAVQIVKKVVILEILLHIGFLLSLISFSVRKMIWLRSLLVLSQTFLFLGVTNLVSELPNNAYWYLVFIAVNLYQIYMLYLESRPVEMSPEEADIYKNQFSRLSQRDFKKLMKLASWRDSTPGETLISDGETLNRLCYLYRGSVEIKKKGQSIRRLNDGRFIGEMSFLTNGSASADVVSKDPVRLVEWNQTQLHFLINKKPHLKTEIQSIIGFDLVEKIKSQNTETVQ